MVAAKKKRRHITDYNKNLASMLEISRIRDNKTKRERHTHTHSKREGHNIISELTWIFLIWAKKHIHHVRRRRFKRLVSIIFIGLYLYWNIRIFNRMCLWLCLCLCISVGFESPFPRARNFIICTQWISHSYACTSNHCCIKVKW